MFNFERLAIWERSIEFAEYVYTLTKTFPDDERFGLTSQMRRAAVSISSNIAEGSSRISKTDFAHFLEYAMGSAFEVVSQAKLSLQLGYIEEKEYRKIYMAAEEQGKMLSGLRKSLGSR